MLIITLTIAIIYTTIFIALNCMSSVKPTRYMADNKLMLAKSGMIVIVIIGFTVQTCYMYGICVRMHDYKMAVHTER